MKAAFIRAVGGDDPHVRRQRQREPSAGRRPIYASHDRLRTAAHGDHDLADLPLAGQARADRARRLRIAPLLQVEAGAERIARALQHHHAHVAPPVEAREELAQLVDQAAREGVEPAGPVHRRPDDLAVLPQFEVRHAQSPFSHGISRAFTSAGRSCCVQ
jgi:hypothetical protein